MARRNVTFVQGGHYHVFNRGANRQPIFREDENYLYLLRRIKSDADEWHVTLLAYCLMPNHYHFVVRQDSDRPISGFVQAVFNSYTKALNKRYGRSGTLFQGPYRAVAVASEEYLTHLCRYVHRNPLEAGLVSRLGDWPYSNFPEWIGERQGTLVDRQFAASRFPTAESYARFVLDYTPPERLEQLVRQLER
ncbi:MAG: REP-associated tyrosine transposase [Anaerolineales bacterium]